MLRRAAEQRGVLAASGGLFSLHACVRPEAQAAAGGYESNLRVAAHSSASRACSSGHSTAAHRAPFPLPCLRLQQPAGPNLQDPLSCSRRGVPKRFTPSHISPRPPPYSIQSCKLSCNQRVPPPAVPVRLLLNCSQPSPIAATGQRQQQWQRRQQQQQRCHRPAHPQPQQQQWCPL